MALDEKGEGTTRVTLHRVFTAYDDSGDMTGEVDCNDIKLGCLVSVGKFDGGTRTAISFEDDA